MDILTLWGDWVWFAAAALGLATTLIALVYALGSILMNDKMKSWAKMELYEVVYSAIVISLGITGITVMDSVVQSSLGVSNVGGTVAASPNVPCGGSITSTWIQVKDTTSGSQVYRCLDICGDPTLATTPGSPYANISSCHLKLGVWYMRELFDESKTFAFDVYLDYIRTTLYSEMTINIEFFTEMAGFFTMTPWRGFYTMGNKVKEMVFDWSMKLMMLLKFQEVLLRFIGTALFPALFVMGAMLRTFMFTRRLGGLLLAMAIALYFIFPAFYAFGALVMLDMKNAARPAWVTTGNDANPACGGVTRNCMAMPDPPIANSMYVKGEIPMPGGSGSISMEDAKRNLTLYEGMESTEYYKQMEKAQDYGLMPKFDLTSPNVPKSEAEQNAAMLSVWNRTYGWFLNLSKKGRMDTIISVAWSPNGPIDVMSKLTFWGMFFSLFGIIGTIAAIRSLAMTFGGDIEIAGLTRLI